MPKNRISLALEGLIERDGHVLASDLVAELSSLLGTLKSIDRHLNLSGGPSIIYEIVGLSHSSPAQIVMQAQPIHPEFDIRDKILGKFSSILRGLQANSGTVDYLDQEILEGVARIVIPIGKTLRSVSLAIDGDEFELRSQIRMRIEKLLGPEETFPGFIRGMMEAINLHKGANIFRIYPDIGPQKITCRFPSELEPDAVKSIGSYVEVRGTLKYKKSTPFPHEIIVDYIEAFPDEASLPSLRDLRGLAPDATGPISSEEFIRKLRNAAN